MGGAVGPHCSSRSSLPRARRLSFAQAAICSWVRRPSSKPVASYRDPAASAHSMVRQFPPRFWQLGRSRNGAGFLGSRSPSARARRMALPVAPAMSEPPRAPARTALVGLFGILPTQSRGATSFAYPAPASAACRPLAGAGRNPAAIRNQAVSASTPSDLFFLRLGTCAGGRVSGQPLG
jgi:hypothetical protein